MILQMVLLTNKSARDPQTYPHLTLQDRTMISYKNKLIFVGAAYICTEDIFPNKRLHQMIQYFCRKMEDRLVKNYGDGIFIEHISDLVSMRKHFSRTYYSLHCCWKSNYQEGRVGNGHQAHMLCL
jgi:hypothetical protein